MMRHLFERLLVTYARRFPMRRGKYRVVERFWKVCAAGGEPMRIARLRYGNYHMDCDIRMMLQRQFYFFGTYFLEERVLNRWSRQAEKADVVFDVGANAGIFSIAAAAANPASAIHSFEPTPHIAGHLRTTVQKNDLEGRIFVHESAVASKSGVAHLNFFSGEHADNEGMNFVTMETRAQHSVAVKAVCLDDFCRQRQIKTVSLVKIDVQGNEPEVLSGAQHLLRNKAIRMLFMELNWWNDEPSKCPAGRVVSMLDNAGYEFADPNTSKNLKFKTAGNWLKGRTDVIARPALQSDFQSISKSK